MLPEFSILDARSVMPNETYINLLRSLIQVLDSLLKPHNPATVFNTSAILPFITRYSTEAARSSLSQKCTHFLEDEPVVAFELRCINLQVILLTEKLPKINLTTRLLQNLLLMTQSSKEIMVMHKVQTSALLMSEFTASLRLEVIPEISTLLATTFLESQESPQSFITSRLRLSRIIRSWLLPRHVDIARAFAEVGELPLQLARCYGAYMSEVGDALGGVSSKNYSDAGDWRAQWVESKVALMDAFHYIVDTLMGVASSPALMANSQDTLECKSILLNMLNAMLDMTIRLHSPTSIEGRVWFINSSLLADYEHSHQLSAKLLESWQSETADSLTIFVATGLRDLINPADKRGADSLGGLRLFLRSDLVKRKIAQTAKEQDIDEDLTVGITQVQDIFPNEDRTFIRAALLHPLFETSSERVIAALLEGSPLPQDLNRLRYSSPLETGSRPSERRNIFQDEMDYSRLRIGKNQIQKADTLLQDKTALEDLKADILRRVAEQSDDDEKPTSEMAAFDDELDVGRLRLTEGIANDGEESSDELIDKEDTSQPKSLAEVENILELAYLESPEIFNRDSSTRRSKRRHELKSQTGWADEQLEGWKIMLERNPRKDKILEKHNFSGNRPLAHNDFIQTPQGFRGARGHADRIDRGRVFGRARIVGRGRGGDPTPPLETDNGQRSAQDRARKERSKNNIRRQGHDKKMGRGAL